MNIATYFLKEITWIAIIINCTLYLHIFTLKNNIMPPVGFKVQLISLNTRIPQKTKQYSWRIQSHFGATFVACCQIPYMGKHSRGKLMWFEWKIAICDKTFAVEFLRTYIADRQGHDSQENICG